MKTWLMIWIRISPRCQKIMASQEMPKTQILSDGLLGTVSDGMHQLGFSLS